MSWLKRVEMNWYKPAWHNLWLWPLAALVSPVVWFKRQRYLHTPLAANPAPVIVVGNISVGGTGKTPLITYLLQQAQNMGLKAAVVSRGYGGKAATYPLVLNAHTPVEEAGDEPYLLYHRLGCLVVVDPRRARAVAKACELGAEIIFSDDGLQHYAMAREAEILVVDGQRGFGNGWLLPVGPLREPVSRQASVDLVLTNGVDFKVQASQLINAQSGAKLDLTELRGRSIDAVCGIGNPARFQLTLNSLGAEVEFYTFADHHAFSAADFSFSDSAKMLVMTEKDWVKCQSFAQPHWWYLTVDAVLTEHSQQAVQQLLTQLTSRSNHG